MIPRYLLSKTKRDGECLIWTGSTVSGYPRTYFDGAIVQVHRLVFFLTKGPIPRGMKILHSCDRPPCIEPNHLLAGTQKQNVDDAMNKKRMACGERSPFSKLTWDNVSEIRKLYGNGGITWRELGKRFGVSHFVIGRIIHNERWKEDQRPVL